MGIYERTIKIAHTENNTTLLGPYNRFVIWVHGCCFECPGCLADNTKKGPFTPVPISTLIEQVLVSNVEGITISGGEPFLQADVLNEFVLELRKKKDVGVIVYSGFTIEQLKMDLSKSEFLSNVDILIDGQYKKELDDGRAYIGSANQRLFYLTDRYKEIGKEYYSGSKRKAEIKLTADQAILIGVPSANTLKAWEDIKEKAGGNICEF